MEVVLRKDVLQRRHCCGLQAMRSLLYTADSTYGKTFVEIAGHVVHRRPTPNVDGAKRSSAAGVADFV